MQRKGQKLLGWKGLNVGSKMNPSDSQRVYLKQLYMYMGLLMYTQSALLRMEPGVITEKKRAT